MSIDPRILSRIRAIQWKYAPGDLTALREIGRRCAETARQRGLVTYSDLVRDIPMRIENLHGGQTFELGRPSWSEVHSAVLGEVLGYLACCTYRHHRVLLSAVAVSKAQSEPGRGFAELARQLNLLKSGRRDEEFGFWGAELSKVHEHYAANDWDDAIVV